MNELTTDQALGVLARGLKLLGVLEGESPLQTFERVAAQLRRERPVPPGRCLRACECVTCRGDVACTRPEGHNGDCVATCHTWVAHGMPEPRRDAEAELAQEPAQEPTWDDIAAGVKP